MKDFEKDIIALHFREMYNETRNERNLKLLSKDFDRLLQQLFELGGKRHLERVTYDEI